MADVITIQDLVDGRLDVKGMATFYNGPAGQKVPRRLADDIETLEFYLEYMRGLQAVYEQPSGIVEVNGVQVKPVKVALDDALNAAVVGGGGLADTAVATVPQFNGAVARTMADVNSDTVSFLGFIPKSEMTAIKNRTSTYDCSAALAAAVATGKRVTVPTAGTYSFTIGYNGTTNFDVVATTSGVVFDLNAVITDYAVVNSGAVSRIHEQNNTTVVAGTSSTTSIDTAGLNTGDWLCFYNPTDFSYSEWRANYRAGEWKQIAYIEGANVYFTKPFYADYAANTLDIYKLNSVKCHVENIHILHKNLKSGAIKFTFSSNASDKDMTFDSKSGSFITYDRCVGHDSINPKGHNVGNNQGLDYAYVISNSQHGRVNGGDIYSQRHAVTTGGGNSICSVPVSDFRTYDATLTNDPQTTVGAADFHGNTRDSSYEQCKIVGGTKLSGGDDCYYIDCDIVTGISGTIGKCSELLGGSFGWIGCRAKVTGNPKLRSGRGLFDIGYADITTINEKTKNDIKLEITNLTLAINNLADTNVSLITYANRGFVGKWNLNVNDINIRSADKLLTVVYNKNFGGSANSDYIIMDNLKGNLPKNFLLSSEEVVGSGFYTSSAMRLMEFSGALIGTSTTTSPVIVTSLATLPMTYPRIPSVFLQVKPTNAYGVAGALTTTAINNATTNNTVKARVTADANYTEATEVTVFYRVGLREC